MASDGDGRPPVWTGHVVLYTADTERAVSFYEQLGLRRVAVMDTFAVLEMRGGTHLALRRDPEKVAPGPAPWDLMVEDLDASHAAWTTAGLTPGAIEKNPIHRSFEITDPDGNVLTVNDSHVVGVV